MSAHVYQLMKTAKAKSNSTDSYLEKIGPATVAASTKKHAAMIAHNTGETFDQYLAIGNHAAKANAHITIAKAYGSEARETELPEEVRNYPAIATAKLRSDNIMIDTAMGASEATTASVLAESLPEASWAGVSFRSPTSQERKRHGRWMGKRLGVSTSHNSLRKNSRVITVYAGATTMDDALYAIESTVSAMPGFDMETKPVPVRKHTPKTPLWGILSATFLGLWLVRESMTSSVHSVSEPLGNIVGGLLDYGWIVAVLFGVLTICGFIVSPHRAVRASLKRGTLPGPSTNAGRVVAPRDEQHEQRPQTMDDGSVRMRNHKTRERKGSYPLNKRAFRADPTVFASMANPHGVSRSSSATAHREPTPELESASGLSLGEVPIPEEALDFGTVIYGEPNSGKSVVIQGLFGYHCKRKAAGESMSLVAFETKGDGAEEYIAQARAHQSPTLRIDANDPDAPAIDVFAVDGDAQSKAAYVVSAMRYAFTGDAIGPRSAEALRAVYPAAYVWTEKRLYETFTGADENHRLVDGSKSVHRIAHALVGAHGEQVFFDIIETMRAYLTEHDDSEVQSAIDSLRPMEEMTATQRRAYNEAPRNKLDDINAMDYFFTPERPKITFAEVITEDRALVINTGTSPHGKMDEEQKQRLTAMMLFALHQAIATHASGFQKAGRRIGIFGDELAMLVGTNAEIFNSLRNQFRAYGVRLFFATQFPAQQDNSVVETLANYHTVGTFVQQSQITSKFIAERMIPDVDESEIRGLDQYVLLYRTQVRGRQQPPVTTKVRNFQEDAVYA